MYILYSKSLDGYYVGFTNCIERRLTEHNRKKGKYTDRGIPWELVYSEVFETKREAKEQGADSSSPGNQKNILLNLISSR